MISCIVIRGSTTNRKSRSPLCVISFFQASCCIRAPKIRNNKNETLLLLAFKIGREAYTAAGDSQEHLLACSPACLLCCRGTNVKRLHSYCLGEPDTCAFHVLAGEQSVLNSSTPFILPLYRSRMLSKCWNCVTHYVTKQQLKHIALKFLVGGPPQNIS